VDNDLLAYLRVFCLDKENLFTLLVGDNASNKRLKLKEISNPSNLENEIRAWSFLKARVELLLKAYATSDQEDVELLTGNALKPFQRLVVQLRWCEKKDSSKRS